MGMRHHIMHSILYRLKHDVSTHTKTTAPYLVAPQIGGRLSSVLCIPMCSIGWRLPVFSQVVVSRQLYGDDGTTRPVCQQVSSLYSLCSVDLLHLLISQDYLKHNEPPYLVRVNPQCTQCITDGTLISILFDLQLFFAKSVEKDYLN